jgi:hypothetical protein
MPLLRFRLWEWGFVYLLPYLHQIWQLSLNYPQAPGKLGRPRPASILVLICFRIHVNYKVNSAVLWRWYHNISMIRKKISVQSSFVPLKCQDLFCQRRSNDILETSVKFHSASQRLTLSLGDVGRGGGRSSSTEAPGRAEEHQAAIPASTDPWSCLGQWPWAANIVPYTSLSNQEICS